MSSFSFGKWQFFCVFFTLFFQHRAVVCYAYHIATRQDKRVNKMFFCGKGKERQLVPRSPDFLPGDAVSYHWCQQDPCELRWEQSSAFCSQSLLSPSFLFSYFARVRVNDALVWLICSSLVKCSHLFPFYMPRFTWGFKHFSPFVWH